MIITISGSPGAGKSTVAKLVAKKLKLKYYSIGILLRNLARKRKISLLEISKLAEKSPKIDRKLDDAQIKLGKRDNFVLDSRLGYHFVPGSIKIFLDVNDEEAGRRIFADKRGVERENTSLKKTIENIKKRKKSEILRYKKYYGINPFDKRRYDLVIDTAGLTPEEAAERVIRFVSEF